MSLHSFVQVVSLTALFNLACNQHDRPLGRNVTGQLDWAWWLHHVADSAVAVRYGTLGARTGGASWISGVKEKVLLGIQLIIVLVHPALNPAFQKVMFHVFFFSQ